MKSLFNTSDNKEIILRISKLTPDSKALWGKMNVTQMLAHCTAGFKSAFGEIISKRSLAGVLFGGIAKRSVLSDKPIKKGLPTDKHYVIKDDRDFENEKKILIGYIKKFAEPGSIALSNARHPFFGKMTPDEWSRLMAKHVDHHLSQFGV